MEFEKRHDTTDFCPRQLVSDLLGTCRCCGLVVNLLLGNWCSGFWPYRPGQLVEPQKAPRIETLRRRRAAKWWGMFPSRAPHAIWGSVVSSLSRSFKLLLTAHLGKEQFSHNVVVSRGCLLPTEKIADCLVFQCCSVWLWRPGAQWWRSLVQTYRRYSNSWLPFWRHWCCQIHVYIDVCGRKMGRTDGALQHRVR